MTTAREIITISYREANYKDIAGVLTDDELAEGLVLLRGIQQSLSGLVVGIRMRPWYVPSPQRTAKRAANYPARDGGREVSSQDVPFPPANSRLLMRNTTDTTIYFPYQPEDGAIMEYIDVGHTGAVTLDANGALIGRTGTVTSVVIGSATQTAPGRNSPRRWIYRMDLGSWIEMVSITLDDETPFPPAYDDYFITLMAIRLSPRFGSEPRQSTVARYREMQAFIRAQWMQTAPQISGELGAPSLRGFEDDAATFGVDGGFYG